MEILPVHGRASLGHLRRQGLPHHLADVFARPHRQRDTQIANHGRHHIPVPRPIVAAKSGTAAQANRGGVNRFLSERSESFSLERGVVVADLASGEELLETIVGGAGDEHPPEHLAALVARERSLQGFTPQETVAGLDELVVRLPQPVLRRHARRRLAEL